MKYLSVTCDSPEKIPVYKEAGADEIIVPVQDCCFTALPEFSAAEIGEWAEEAHACGMRVCALMNLLAHEDDAGRAQGVMDEVMRYADSVILADPGMIRHAIQGGYADRVIYDPLTLMTSAEEAEVWKSFGLQSVTISPLLTKQEILQIASRVPGCGIPVHGYQLMSVSGRKLLTAFADVSGSGVLRHRTDLWLREETREERMPVYENERAMLIYTDYVQDSFDELPDFAKHGITRFEICTLRLSDDQVIDAIRICRGILGGSDMNEEIREYRKKYQELPLSDGYYGQKTIK